MDERRLRLHRAKAQRKLADARRLATVMRSVRSFYIRYRLAAAHVHCARPVGHGTDSLIFCLDRPKLLIIKENKHRLPGRGLEPPRCYPLVPETSASHRGGSRNVRTGPGAVN